MNEYITFITIKRVHLSIKHFISWILKQSSKIALWNVNMRLERCKVYFLIEILIQSNFKQFFIYFPTKTPFTHWPRLIRLFLLEINIPFPS